MERCEGSDVDDAAAVTGLGWCPGQHVGTDVAAECPDGLEVDLEDLISERGVSLSRYGSEWAW